MSKSTHREPVQTAQSAVEDDHAAGLTRRTVLAGVAATTAVATVGVDTPTVAQSANPDSDMVTFVQLSEALTGIPAGKLAPATDSIGIKHDYFKWVNEREPAAFASLMKIAKDNANSSQAMIEKSQATDDTKFLARSIVLMWYLGSWYAPADLKKLVDSKSSPSPLFIPHTVISPKAYTQGWVWRVAQAHPMGYSDLQFGYWMRDPAPLEDFITLRTKGKGT
jgi:Membrane bound FAD containing D-sorbitol dehydrogenase